MNTENDTPDPDLAIDAQKDPALAIDAQADDGEPAEKKADPEFAEDLSHPEIFVPDHDDVVGADGEVVPEHGHCVAETRAQRQERLKRRHG